MNIAGTIAEEHSHYIEWKSTATGTAEQVAEAIVKELQDTPGFPSIDNHERAKELLLKVLTGRKLDGTLTIGAAAATYEYHADNDRAGDIDPDLERNVLEQLWINPDSNGSDRAYIDLFA